MRPTRRPGATRARRRRRRFPRRGRAARRHGRPSAFVLGQALELELAPAEAVAQRARTDDRGLDAADRQGDVGQREETAPPAQPGGGPVEPEAIVAQEGAGHPGGEAEGDQQHAARQHGDELVRQDQVGDRRAGVERLAPEASGEEIEAGDIAHGLGAPNSAARTASEKLNKPASSTRRTSMAKTGAASTSATADRIDRRAAPRADLVAQRLGAGERDRGQRAVVVRVPGRTPGLEFDAAPGRAGGQPGPG